MRTIIYDSLAAFLNVAATGTYERDERDTWNDNMTLPEAVAYFRRGAALDSLQVRTALALMHRIDASAQGRERAEWLPSVGGAFPVVAEYLAGMPLNMRERKRIQSDVAPIRLVMECGVSAGVSHTQMTKRGAAMAALAERMSEIRPTELYICDMMGDYDRLAWMARLETAPVNLPQACAAFCSPAFGRKVTFNHHSVITGNSNYSWGIMPGPGRETALRKAFNLNPQDIIVQGGYLDQAGLMDKDPVAWVNRELDKQRNIEA